MGGNTEEALLKKLLVCVFSSGENPPQGNSFRHKPVNIPKSFVHFFKCMWLTIFLGGRSIVFMMLLRKPVIPVKEVVKHLLL